jgi:hypothetical protein
MLAKGKKQWISTITMGECAFNSIFFNSIPNAFGDVMIIEEGIHDHEQIV